MEDDLWFDEPIDGFDTDICFDETEFVEYTDSLRDYDTLEKES